MGLTFGMQCRVCTLVVTYRILCSLFTSYAEFLKSMDLTNYLSEII
jgi:hypothetical protein